MIEWIKFKGSTEEEREKEAILPCVVYSGKFVNALYKNHLFILMNCTHWAPINLPEEEKWERKCQYADDRFKEEFDNIYEKLNELRKR